ncbi:MAG: OmpH family outer membrane protein [Thermoanaerobaculia bacterium]
MWNPNRKPSFHCVCLVLAAVLSTAVLSTGEAAAQDDQVKIAVVNLDFIVANSPAGKALQAQLEAFRTDVQAEAEKRAETARDIRRRIAEGANTLSEEKLGELSREYEDAQIGIKRYQDDKQREGQKLQSDGLKKIEDELEPVFTNIRDEGGYDLILNNVPGVVVMVGTRIDITQQVIDRLKAEAGG